MALPLLAAVPWAAALVGGIVAGLAQFVATRMAWVLAGLGVGWVTMTGMQTLAGYVLADMNLALGAINSGAGGASSGLGPLLLQAAAYAGLFDGLNIVLGGFMASYGLMAMRVVLRKLQG